MDSIVATYGLSNDGPRVLIEQTEYAPSTGLVSTYAMAVLLKNLIYGEDEEIPVDCGFDGDYWQVAVMFYPEDPNMSFTPYLSRGSITIGPLVEEEREEIINFRLDESVTLEYPCVSILYTEWMGDAYGEDMETTTHPGLTFDSETNSVIPDKLVYASVKVTYLTKVLTCQCVIEGREESVENAWTSVAYAVHSSGVDWLELDPPPGADEYDGDCSGGDLTVNPPEPSPDAPPGADRLILKDYCTQVVISDTVG